MEWLANISWQWVIAIVIVLAAIRLALGKSKGPLAKQTAEIAESLAIAMALVFLIIRPFIVQAFFIPSGSMIPTLIERDHLLVNKFIYRFTEPDYGDIIVFRSPPEASPDGKPRDFIKRVVGLPGDEIEIKRGYALIGGSEYDHYDLRSILARETYGDVRVRLTEDRVYVSGKAIDKKTLAVAADRPGADVELHPGVVVRNGEAVDEPYVAEDSGKSFGPMTVGDDKLLLMGDNRNDSNDSREWGELDRDRVLGKAMFIFWPVNRVQWIR